MIHAKDHPYFTTITCLEWKPIIASDAAKQIILDSLNFLTAKERITVYAFCLMSNHIHLIWQMLGDHRKENVQRDFLKYTGQRLLILLDSMKSPLFDELKVNAADRQFQIWERNALSIPLYSDSFFTRSFITSIKIPSQQGCVIGQKTIIIQVRSFILGTSNILISLNITTVRQGVDLHRQYCCWWS